MEHLDKLVSEWKQGKRNEDWRISLKDFIIRDLIIGYLDIEKVFFPVQLGNIIVQFTNFYVQSKSSGNNYYLVYINGKLSFYLIGYEPDCDGSFYYGTEVSILDVVNYISEFNTETNLYSIDLCKEISKINTTYNN